MAHRDEIRVARVREHFEVENRHDLDGIVATFHGDPSFTLNGMVFPGREGVRAVYADVLGGFPDLHFELTGLYPSRDEVVVECMLRGTHTAPWQGIAATGKRIEVACCCILPFDADDRLLSERVYFDRAVLLQQLGALGM
jgi:steroid delta-isomerase-like uncharacterized protein